MNEAMGKVLGMAMAYGVSSLGLLLAYVNYRKRIVKAEKVMSPTAWAVIVASLLAVAAGAGVVASLAARAEAPTPALTRAAEGAKPEDVASWRFTPDHIDGWGRLRHGESEHRGGVLCCVPETPETPTLARS